MLKVKNNVNSEIFPINNVTLANTLMVRSQQMIQINMDRIKITIEFISCNING